MGRLAVSLFLLLVLTGTAGAQAPDSRSALIDSLLYWHQAHRPDLVDSLAAPAITDARAAADSSHLMHLLLVRGATRAGVGRARQAEADLREGMALATAAADTVHQIQILRWLAFAIGRQGRTGEATDLYTELETWSRAAADSVHLGWAWVGLAYDHYLQGRGDTAATTYAQAAGVLQRNGEVAGATWAWNGHGMALRELGRYREARIAFQNVLDLARADGNVVNEAMALNNLGRLDIQLGDPGQAVELFRQSAEIHRAARQHREGLLLCIDMASAMTMQGRFAEVEAALDSVLTECRTLGLRDLELLANGQLAEAWLDQGRPGAAAAGCRAMLAEGEMPSRLVDTETRLRLARALVDRDSLDAAIGVLAAVHAEGAGAVSLEWRVTAPLGALLVDRDRPQEAAEVLRAAIATARTAGDHTELVVLRTHLGRAETALDRPDSALAVYARAIASWERVRAWPGDPVWREWRGTVSGSLFAHAVAARLAASDLTGAWAWAQRHKARTLQERMLGPGAVVGESPSPDLHEFRTEVLRPGEVFLDLIEGQRLSVLFCVTRDTALAANLPGRHRHEAHLNRLADVVRSTAIDVPDPAVSLAVRLLDAWPAGVRELAADADAVIWCPDGSWHRLPTALLGWSGSLTHVPAAGVLARLQRQEQAAPEAATILAVTGPGPADSGPLPGALRETSWLTSRFEAVTTLTPPRSCDSASWPAADVLHIAAHTELDAYQPWQTSIDLDSGPEASLRAADIAELEFDACLAVLAGCTTAGRHIVGGEGLIGLAGAFLAARTPAVLATLWPVDDAIAYQVTTSFYESLADGLTAAEALGRARRACLDDPIARAPRHWAAFVLVGDGGTTVPLSRRAPLWPWAAGLGALALVAYLISRK